MIHRETNSYCLTCGGQLPSRVLLEQANGRYRYYCPDCNDTIIEGVVATDGDVAGTAHSSPRAVRDIVLPERITWDTWEAWWTRLQHVVLIHGRIIHGTQEFAEFVDMIRTQANG